MNIGKHTLLLPVTLVAVVAAASVAQAQIVVDQSVAGVRLGATKASVVRAVGKPTSKNRCGGSPRDRVLCGGKGVENWGYAEMTVNFIDGRVAEIGTSFSNKEKTADGVGVGTPFAKVRRLYPNGTVGQRFSYAWFYLGDAPAETGDRYTRIDTTTGKLSGKVRDITMGRYDKRFPCVFMACG